MHPDRKIGIAMGILLVGVVAALFFRNEPLPVENSLSAERERQLNAQLRERDVAVYLESDAAPAANADEPEWTLADVLSGAGTAEEARPIRLPNLTSPSQVGGLTRSPPAFTPPVRYDQETAQQTQSAVAEVQPQVGPSVELSSEAVQPQADPGTFEEYKIQYGDTLSGISSRFLGAHHRYSEIYDANKDRIDDPDRLRVGTAIRIPRVIR